MKYKDKVCKKADSQGLVLHFYTVFQKKHVARVSTLYIT